MSDGDGQDLPAPLEPTVPQNTMPEFAGYVVNRLFSIGLSLESARSIVGKSPAGNRIAAAIDELDHMIRDIRVMVFGLAADRDDQSPDRWSPTPAGHAGCTEELLGSVVKCIFNVGGLLQGAADLPQDVTRLRLAEALHWLNDLAVQIRDHAFTESGQEIPPGPARRVALPGGQEHLARTADRSALLRERAAQTARTLQAAAADAVALLEQQADLARQPGRVDYPTEIKRWRAFADQAEQMAKRWEQPP